MAPMIFTFTIIVVSIGYVLLVRHRRLRLAMACLLGMGVLSLVVSLTLVDYYVGLFGLGIFVACRQSS